MTAQTDHVIAPQVAASRQFWQESAAARLRHGPPSDSEADDGHLGEAADAMAAEALEAVPGAMLDRLDRSDDEQPQDNDDCGFGY